MVEYLEFRVIQELAERYPDLGLESEPHLTSALEKIYSVHRKGFVFTLMNGTVFSGKRNQMLMLRQSIWIS